jgi:ankyrin repeat protein
LATLLDACSSRAARTKLLAREDGEGYTLLRRACGVGHFATARALCAAGAIVDNCSVNGSTALIRACWRGHFEIVRFFVLEGSAIVTQRGADGATALSVASVNGHVAVVRFLLVEGNAARIEDMWHGATSLVFAAWRNHLHVVRVLLLAADVAPCLSTTRLAGVAETTFVTVAAAAYDSAGAIGALIANTARPPGANVPAAWAGAAAQAQEKWLMDALARAIRGKCTQWARL